MIPIRNIYYMLAYAFQVLNPQGYKQVSVEQFDNVLEMLSSVLVRGVSIQIKQWNWKWVFRENRTFMLASWSFRIIRIYKN